MNIKSIITLLAVLALAAPIGALAVDPKYARSQEQADEYYAEGEYKKAYKKYLYLAKVGDSFAQYRVSYMKNYGQGVTTDTVGAYGWSVLAAQNGSDQLVAYNDALWNELPSDDQAAAREEAEKLMSKYGNLALAEKAQKNTRRRLRGCTGSRLSTRCEDVVVTNLGIGMGTAPGGANGGEPGGVDRTNMPAEPSQEGAADPQFVEVWKLREAQAQLDQYIEENSGSVEIGEFEVIEGEAQPQPAEPASDG